MFQEETAIICGMIVHMILSKKDDIKTCPILFCFLKIYLVKVFTFSKIYTLAEYVYNDDQHSLICCILHYYKHFAVSIKQTLNLHFESIL